MVNEVTILDTVFRDNGALGIGAVAHPENVLRRHVVFRHPPLNLLRLVNGLLVVTGNQNDFIAAIFRDNVKNDELLAVHVVVRRECADFNVDEVAYMKADQILAIKLGYGAVLRMLRIDDFFNGVADVLRRDVVQLVRGQVEVAAEIRVHIDLETPTHQNEPQIVFSTGDGDFRVFDVDQCRVVAVPGPAKLLDPARQL